jgi:flavin reductase (DIM6/NTAB) family NADH-FMN oxidoreductase RutF
VHQRVSAGDHTVLFGRVLGFGTSHAAPLAFSRDRYAEVRPR